MNNTDQDRESSQDDPVETQRPAARVVDDATVMQAELIRILERRWQLKNPPPKSGDAAPCRNELGDPRKDAVGLALSGGGIRSATFSLGLLQALQRDEMFWKIDYLSTVSGGGYIGSCLTWFMSCLGVGFPFGTKRADNQGAPGAVVNWLRDHGRYLTPGRGMGAFALVAAVLTGLAVNLAIMLPIFCLLILLLGQKWPLGPLMQSPHLRGLLEHLPQAVRLHAALDHITGYQLAQFFGGMALILFLVFVVLQAWLSGWARFSAILTCAERPCEKWKGRLLLAGIILLLVGWLPCVRAFLWAHGPAWAAKAGSEITLMGILSAAGALIGRKPGGQNLSWVRSFFLCIGLSLVIYGFAIWFSDLGTRYPLRDLARGPARPLLIATAALCLSLGYLANVNRMSMHRFYRNRLRDAYLPDARELPFHPPSAADPESCLLRNIPQTAAPYQLINAAQNTVGSQTPRLRERGADNFLFSPLYCGSTSAGYMKTTDFCNGGTNLATSMAISGAAVDPNTYATRSRALSFIMSFLNVRLGYWINTPGHPPLQRGFWRPPWYRCMLYEMFGVGLGEHRDYQHLSDGGQFENLGLYELVRRKCRWIIVSDATADPQRQFPDLGKAIELVRTDFGARLELDTAPLRIPAADGTYPAGFVAGTILYADQTTGNVLYVKPSILKDTREDVLAYHRKNPTFPAQSTGDQFFDEQQFEAYRELGFQIGRTLKDWLAGIWCSGIQP